MKNKEKNTDGIALGAMLEDMTEQNTAAILEAGHKGQRAARDMANELVRLGATPNEISDAIEQMTKTARDAAITPRMQSGPKE